MSTTMRQMPLSPQQPLVLARPSLALQMIPPRSGAHDLGALQSAMHSLVLDDRHPVALELVGFQT